jgi:dihydrofolate reductase
MEATNNVYIATSADGFIADKNGGIDWLNTVPNPTNDDMGFTNFTSRMDALVMGRTTYETVLGFGIDWPYTLPVYVLSTTLKEVPKELADKVFIVNGSLQEVLDGIHANGHRHLYIDGGRTIQSFLAEGRIDSLIISQIPVLLGAGTPLFKGFEGPVNLELVSQKVLLNAITQTHYNVVK